jgi:predicted aconitase
MQFVRDEDGEAYRALELVAKGVPHHQAEELLKLDRLNHRAALRAGMAIVVTILKLKAM